MRSVGRATAWLALLLLVALAAPSVEAHPLSYTDAWARLQPGRLQIRLNVFLDDILRYQTDWTPEETTLPSDTVAAAVEAFAGSLPQRLTIRTDTGYLLPLQVIDVPKWSTTSETTDVAADANLKLTYQVAADLPQQIDPLQALIIRHSLSPPGIDGVGELRLHLQDQAAGRRTDVVVPADQPHAIVLPSASSEQTRGDVNRCRIQVLMTPRVTTVEFEAPLLRLREGLVPEPADDKEGLDVGNGNAGPLSIEERSRVLGAIEEWFRRNLRLSAGEELSLTSASAELLPLLIDSSPELATGDAGDSAGGAASRNSLPSEHLELLRIGVRMQFRPATGADELQVVVAENPGSFVSADVTLVTPAGSQTQSVDFVPTEPALQKNWTLQANVSAAAARTDVDDSLTDELRPAAPLVVPVGRSISVARGAGLMTAAVVFVLAALINRRRWKALLISGALVVGIGGWLASEVRFAADSDRAAAYVQQVLDRVYRVLNGYSDEQAVPRLSVVLEDDLLEGVYVAAAAALPVDASLPTVVDVSEVALLDFELTGVESTFLRTRCQWQVTATVFHWGHQHERQATLTAELNLRQEDGRWKLSHLELLQPVKFSTDPIVGGRS
ncbi:MAG: hypothetical protein Fues2KO_32410 [Fuerstiella sp.]